MLASELADELEVSEATISRIASGERRPSLDLMYKIRSALRWSIEAQVDEIQCGVYSSEFKKRMERRRARSHSSTLRSLSEAGSGGQRVPALETGTATY